LSHFFLAIMHHRSSLHFTAPEVFTFLLYDGEMVPFRALVFPIIKFINIYNRSINWNGWGGPKGPCFNFAPSLK